MDRAILTVFVAEIILRLYVHRRAFWRDPWSVFDFAVVAIALLPATGQFAVLRALRVLRAEATLAALKKMLAQHANFVGGPPPGRLCEHPLRGLPARPASRRGRRSYRWLF
ncbi:MAG: ion transporter [Sulfuricella sp.]